MSTGKTFYVDPKNVNTTSFILDKEESHHIAQVLRLGIGSIITLLDGIGSAYRARINSVNNGVVSGIIEKTLESYGENKVNIRIAPAIIKRNRFENLLEKVTELGCKEIQPLLTERSIKRTINIERSEKIIVSASKQCQRSNFPIIYRPIDISSWLNGLEGQCFAGNQRAKHHLSELKIAKDQVINVMIGPEGDFSDKELDIMKNKGVMFYSLGTRRLRTETAAQSTLSILNELMI